MACVSSVIDRSLIPTPGFRTSIDPRAVLLWGADLCEPRGTLSKNFLYSSPRDAEQFAFEIGVLEYLQAAFVRGIDLRYGPGRVERQLRKGLVRDLILDFSLHDPVQQRQPVPGCSTHASQSPHRCSSDVEPFLPEGGLQVLSEISLDAVADVPAQVKLSADYGVAVIGIALNYFVHTNHTVALRIYRPGFELVELHSWERGGQAVWKPADGVVAQEQVLDRLFPIDRLAVQAPDEEDSQRLRSKAVVLRDRALGGRE